MSRRRLTGKGLFTRTAAPDEVSGRNPNVPIHLYDIKPNARFPIGCEVTFLDDQWLKVRGVVLGHAAEDRVWVQLPASVEQLDVEDIIAFHETKDKMGEHPTDPLVASRGSRHATILTFEEIDSHAKDAGLDYIPDQEDFRDGDPVAPDEHPGELPSEQDPRDKIEEESPYKTPECEEHELIIEIPDLGDMTDLIEGRFAASRKEALFGRRKPQQPEVLKSLLGQKDENGNPLYANEAEAALNYNLFKDPGIIRTLKAFGLHDDEVETFANIRQHQLDQAKARAYQNQPESKFGIKKPPQYAWGQGTGIRYNIKSKADKPTQSNWVVLQQWLAKMEQKRQQQGGLSPKEEQGVAIAKSWQNNPSTENVALLNRWVAKLRNRSQQTQQAQPVQQTQPTQPAATASRELRHQANLIGGLLGMPRTAAMIYQAAETVEAVQEENTDDLDETSRRALRNASRGLMAAIDHLRGVNNRIANLAADKIEQIYADSLC